MGHILYGLRLYFYGITICIFKKYAVVGLESHLPLVLRHAFHNNVIF